MAKEVFVVSSERDGVKENLKVFGDFDRAEDFALGLEKQIKDRQTETVLIEGFILD